MRSHSILLVAALAVGTGCGGGGGGASGGGGGGGGGGGANGNVATTAGGEAITSASGQAVTREAHQHWTDAITKFNNYEQQGWNSDRCREVLSDLDEANDEQNGRFAEAVYMSGLVSERCGERSDARRFYERALSISDSVCGARVGLGLMELADGDRAGAKQAFTTALEKDGQCTPAYVNLAMLQAQESQEQEAEALNNLRRALAITSDYMPAFNEMALIYYRQGQRASNVQALDLAEIVCRQAQLLNANYAPIYNTWGLIRLRRGDINDALRYFQRATELDSSLYEAQMNFGQITFSFRGYEDAQRAFQRATELRPRSYEAAVGLGSALRGLNRVDEAKAQYERAIQLDANRPEAYFNLAILYNDYMSGAVPDLQQALRYLDQFLAKAGNNATYADTVTEVTRQCAEQQQRPGRRRLARGNCRPGRKQLIQQTIRAIQEGEQMQREAEQMQREAEQQQQQQQ